MKKKNINIQQWLWIAGIPSAVGVIILLSRTIVAYADMPKRVDTIEQYIQAQQKMTEVQAEANNLMRQQIQQQTRPYCEVYQNETWCWDEYNQTWYQQGG